MTTKPVAVRVSHATRLAGSSRRQASRMASEIWSAILSGCPSVTDSEVNRTRFVGKLISPKGVSSRAMRGAYDTKWLLSEVPLVLTKTVPEMFFRRNDIGVTVTRWTRVVTERIERQRAAGKRKKRKTHTYCVAFGGGGVGCSPLEPKVRIFTSP